MYSSAGGYQYLSCLSRHEMIEYTILIVEKEKKSLLKKMDSISLSLNSEFGHVFCFGQQDKIKLIRAETLKAFIY